jgi:hypothetical protein
VERDAEPAKRRNRSPPESAGTPGLAGDDALDDVAGIGVGETALRLPCARLALAGFERDLIRERAHAGLAAARARGRRGGRPTVMTPETLKAARQLYDARRHTIAEIAAILGVSRASIYRSLNDTAAGPPVDGTAIPTLPLVTRTRAPGRLQQTGRSPCAGAIHCGAPAATSARYQRRLAAGSGRAARTAGLVGGLAVEIERRLGMPLCREVDRRAVYEPSGEE